MAVYMEAPAGGAVWPPADTNKVGKTIPPGNPEKLSILKMAQDRGLDPKVLLDLNFANWNGKFSVVNWYLKNKCGCTQATADGKNWKFTGGETIYVPVKPPTQITLPAPKAPVESIFSKYWTQESVDGFRKWISRTAPGLLGRIETCSNFAVLLLFRYAAEKELPVALNGFKPIRFESETGAAYPLLYPKIEKLALENVLAEHLNADKEGNTVRLGSHLDCLPGDILTQAKHVQVVLNPNSTIQVYGNPKRVFEIMQGNLDYNFPIVWRESGVPVQRRAYDLNKPGDYYTFENGQWELTYTAKITDFTPRRWKFGFFNSAYGLPEFR